MALDMIWIGYCSSSLPAERHIDYKSAVSEIGGTMTRLKSIFAVLLLTIFALAFPAATLADSVDSRITAVTVYADRAIVTRATSSQLAAGEQTLIFENLPASLVDQSLQASGFGVNGATILDVTVSTLFAEFSANESVKRLEDQLKVLQKQRRALDDRGKILEEQHSFVQRMLQSSTSSSTGGGPGATALARPSLDEWQKLYGYAEETLGKLSTEQQSIDGQREELQAKQSALERQLNELRGARGKQSKTVRVRVALTTAGKLEVLLRYSLPNAAWSPAYDARLRSVDRAVDLSYFGNVRNGTGEDWKNVALTLSTARPSLGGGAPELRPWITDILRPRSPSVGTTTVINPDLVGEVRLALTPVDAELGRGNGNAQVITKNQSFKGSGPAATGGITPLPKESEAAYATSGVEAGITSATFKIPVSVSIPGDNVSQKVAIREGRFAATLQFQSTPRVMEAAFLSAYAVNNSEFPLLAGPMNTFLDDTFVAASNQKTVMPGEKFELALGVDDGISVKRRLVNRFTEETGMGNKAHKVTYDILVTLTNNKNTAERVVFKEPTPISRDEKIQVRVLTPQEKEIGTQANPKDVTREEDGKLVWRVTLKPGEKREFPLKLSVEHPGDVTVTGLD